MFLDPVFVARSSLVLSWVLDQTWVLDFCLRLFAELDLTHCLECMYAIEAPNGYGLPADCD